MIFREYIENYIKELKNLNDKPKVKFFLEYLSKDMGEDILNVPDLFSILDRQYLLASIENYIYEVSPSKQTAEDYRRAIIGLCENVCEKYGLKNEFLESVSEQEEFHEIFKLLLDSLKEPKSRQCMTDEDFENLIRTIKDFYNIDNIEEKIKNSIEIQNYKPNHYAWLVSCTALVIVQKYGLNSKAIANLKITDINVLKKTMNVNGFDIPLDEEVFGYIEIYLKFRDFVVSIYDQKADELFLKKNGTPYLDKNGQVNNSQLFLVMDTVLGKTDVSSLRYRTIIDCVLQGANINLLSRLTQTSEETIAKICHDDELELTNSLYNILNGISERTMKEKTFLKKGMIKCPYCGNYREAISENWILIQVVGEEIKHLACRECRGLDGKYRY